jgi:TorA maturation chaperone TorD
MPIEHDTSFVTILQGRRATYQFLARLFRVEVDQELYETLVAMRFPTNTGDELVDEGYRLICDYLGAATSDVLTELAIDYVRTFIGSGNTGFSAAYPYESVYTSPKRLLMQDARDEVLVLYRAAGLEKQDSWKEGEDHLALELEFEQILAQRAAEACEANDDEGCLLILRQQRNFLEDHLLAWYPMMAADMEKFARTDFYRGLAKLTSGFLRNDLALLDDVLEGATFEGDMVEDATLEGTSREDATFEASAPGEAAAKGVFERQVLWSQEHTHVETR